MNRQKLSNLKGIFKKIIFHNQFFNHSGMNKAVSL